jgi:hypothetical protein
MTTPKTILEAQVQAMLEHLRRYEVEQIDLEMDRGHAIAAGLLQNAHRRAREHMRHRIQRERRRMRLAEQSAKARLATKKRVAAHARTNTLIEGAREFLPRALRDRWMNKESRQEWCKALLQQTCRSLQGPEILVEHPEDWDRDERRAFLNQVQQHFGKPPRAKADAGLLAGLRIHSGNAWLDGSITGLLAQQNRIDAQLAALLVQARSDQAEEISLKDAVHG